MHTADFVGLYTATRWALWVPQDTVTCPSAANAALELDFGAFYFRCRRVLVKPSLLGFRTLTPLCKLDCAL